MVRTAQQPQSVFRSSEFRRYYAGQALSYLGDGLRTLVIPLLVFHLTGSAVSLGLTFAFELLPFALFSLLGGSLADRLNRRTLMLAADAVRFVIMALFCIALWRGVLTLPLLYSGVVLLSICAAIFLGAQASSIPYLLGKDRAKAAVAALVATEQGVNLIAPPLGGAIFGLVGALPALAINAATYLTSQISIASVPSFGPERPGGFPPLAVIAPRRAGRIPVRHGRPHDAYADVLIVRDERGRDLWIRRHDPVPQARIRRRRPNRRHRVRLLLPGVGGRVADCRADALAVRARPGRRLRARWALLASDHLDALANRCRRLG
jgi:MFS family permease